MSGEPFIDTNVWVYAHLETPDEPKAVGRVSEA
jgi:predicted nucleic acid-binding protein